jgi:hypothetical protein
MRVIKLEVDQNNFVLVCGSSCYRQKPYAPKPAAATIFRFSENQKLTRFRGRAVVVFLQVFGVQKPQYHIIMSRKKKAGEGSRQFSVVGCTNFPAAVRVRVGVGVYGDTGKGCKGISKACRWAIGFRGLTLSSSSMLRLNKA